jgi:hypothetical protein
MYLTEFGLIFGVIRAVFNENKAFWQLILAPIVRI